MFTVKCLHCGSEANPEATAGYCEDCGKKLPLGQHLTTSHSARSRIRAELERQGTPDWNVRLTGLLFVLGGILFGGLLLMAITHPGTAGSPVLRRVVIGLLVACLLVVLFGVYLLIRGKTAAED